VTRAPLPPPLPPETRTVGQLVAETLRLYGRRFWRSLLLGVPVAAVNMLAVELPPAARYVVIPLAYGVVFMLVLLAASVIALERRPESPATASVGGILVLLPFPLLVSVFVLPGLVWLALFGLIVPAAVAERLSLRQGFARALALGRADFVHAVGSFATLVIVVFLTQATLFVLLRAQGEQAAQIASFLAGAVVSPIFFLGAALLYLDQEARYRVKT
jgi:hypothetical protein